MLSWTAGSQQRNAMIKAMVVIRDPKRQVWCCWPAFWERGCQTTSSVLLAMGWLEVPLLDSLKTLSPTLPGGARRVGRSASHRSATREIDRYLLGAAFPSTTTTYKIKKALLDHLQERIWLCRQKALLIPASSLGSS